MEGIKPTKEKLEEVNLGADPRNLGPILISSQYRKKEQLVELLKKYEDLLA